MAQLDTTNTFADGNIVNAASLNNIIDQASALVGLISAQTIDNTVTVATDYVMYYDSVAAALKRCTIASLQATGGITTVSSASSKTFITLVTTTPVAGERRVTVDFIAQTQNKVLAAPADGSTGAVSFRQLVPADTDIYTSITALNVDLSQGHVFTKTLTATPTTLSLINGIAGQVIKVRVQQTVAGNALLHWSSPGTGVIRWPGGTEPVLTTGASRIDIFEFLCVGADNYYGIRWGKDLLP